MGGFPDGEQRLNGEGDKLVLGWNLGIKVRFLLLGSCRSCAWSFSGGGYVGRRAVSRFASSIFSVKAVGMTSSVSGAPCSIQSSAARRRIPGSSSEMASTDSCS